MKFTLFLLIIFCGIFFSPGVMGQCTTLGQNPSTAFPVCGTATFSQKDVPLCGGRFIPSPCSRDEGLSDVNPFWYKFTAFTEGTLGFVITPATISDDYDWQVFDITNRNPDDVYTDASLFVASNWSGEGGKTGASAAGTSLNVCGGYGKPLYSSMPKLKKGHNYLLLVSHFTQTQSGYTLEFKGGTASITDTTQPALVSAFAGCDARTINVVMNKRMRCSSLAANGSDFYLDDPSVEIIGAASLTCSKSFDMDTLQLQLKNSLKPGSYKLSVKRGSDNNTILDYCNTGIPVDDELSFQVLPVQPTPFDSMVAVTCAPQQLEFYFRNSILCNSVGKDGKEFIVRGPQSVSVVSAEVNCIEKKTTSIRITLSAPLVKGGDYSVELARGADGNTLIDECSQETPVGSVIRFFVKDTVSANFTYKITPRCKDDLVQFNHDGKNEVDSWKWDFDDEQSREGQAIMKVYGTQGSHQVSLVVSNGFCSDTGAVSFVLDEKLNAAFLAPEVVCPNEWAQFVDNSTGPVSSWQWDFANGNRSAEKSPAPQPYNSNGREHTRKVELVVSDGNCTDTAVANILVVTSCMIAVPNAFTPNGDGINDYLFPSNAYRAGNLVFQVFNRFGQKIFETRDWTKRWDGTFNGKPADAGTYVWVLSYVYNSDSKKRFYKGTTVLIR